MTAILPLPLLQTEKSILPDTLRVLVREKMVDVKVKEAMSIFINAVVFRLSRPNLRRLDSIFRKTSP